jgi:hypothetical protein
MFIRYATKDTHARIECDKIAAHGDGRIMVLSCHGPQQTLRGLGALLVSDAKVKLEWYDDNDGRNRPLERDGSGYKCHKHLLCQGLWHFVWVSKDPRLLVAGKDALGTALWSEAYTTPLLDEWIDAIRAALEEGELLATLQNVGWDDGPAYLTAKPEELDAIVSKGILNGLLKVA